MSPVRTLTRILLVEDHDDSRFALDQLLRHRGFEVEAFAHANGNIDAMAEFDPHVALLDVRMPGRSGDELAPELIQRCPGTQIIFLTGESRLDSLKSAVPSCLVIRKPVDVAVLLQLIDCLPPAAG